MDLIGFFDSQDEEIADDFNYFDNLCKKELLMNDPYVVEMIKRLRRARDRYKTYIQARKVDKEKRETNPHNEKAEEAL